METKVDFPSAKGQMDPFSRWTALQILSGATPKAGQGLGQKATGLDLVQIACEGQKAPLCSFLPHLP